VKDAVGGSLLLNMVVLFTSIVILFFAGIMAYSKAYKAKNKIIEVIEGYEKYDSNVAKTINEDLRLAGYRNANNTQINQKCETGNLNIYGYYYCVYRDDSPSGDSYSYKVVTYVHFDFPVIGNMLVFPVKGETKILGKVYNY
jgi:uncharacterized protein (UPF0333 family)